MGEATVVAKKKATKPGGQRDALVSMRCKPEFKAWLEGFADRERLTPAQVIELGLVELAKLRVYDAPPRR